MPETGNYCRDCRKFRPDAVNPLAGLGDCDEPKQPRLMLHYEHKEHKWIYQEKLTYPGSEACKGFEQ